MIELSDNPLAADADPGTSHAAADAHDRSGARLANATLALDLALGFPGSTGWELWSYATQEQRDQLRDHQTLYKRLSDLRHAEHVRQGPKKVCNVKSKPMVTWHPAGTP